MLAYIIRRVLLIVPTLFGIMLLNFAFIQFAPGGPVEQVLAQVQGRAVSATQRLSSAGGETLSSQGKTPSQGAGVSGEASHYRGARGLDPALIRDLEKRFGFDKPAPERFLLMMKQFVLFDFGNSFFQDRRVIDLVLDKLPVSISLGLWATLLAYLVCIPLGIAKAVRDGSRFDLWTTTVIVVGNAIPSFLFAILLIVLFAGGSYLQWFPLRGLVSENWASLAWPARIVDYFWHMTLPLVALVVGSFASLTMLTKNSFLDQINMQYVVTARAKGLSERRVLYGHVFRNAMLIVISGFPGAFISAFFTGSLLIENIFSLDGLGLLGFKSVLARDYPVVFATLYIFSLMGLFVGLVSDLIYTWIDPRIDFERRDV